MPFFSALSFTTPLILTALLTLPLVWLLLRATPPQPSRVRFPAFVILQKLANPEETPSKTPWWLLLLRLLAAALLIIGLAGPVLNAQKATPQSTPLLIVVDDSWVAAPEWRQRRDLLNELAEDIRSSPRHTFLILTASTTDADPLQPLDATELGAAADGVAPAALRPDYARAQEAMETLPAGMRFDVRWLSDGVAHPGSEEFSQALRTRGDVRVYLSTSPIHYLQRDGADTFLRKVTPTGAAPQNDATEETKAVIALAANGRELGRTQATEGEAIDFNLPLALRNDVARARIDGVSSAGAVQLSDGRDRRALVGIIDTGAVRSDTLLSGAYYIRNALAPFAEFLEGDLGDLMQSDASVIVLDDLGSLRAEDAEAIEGWIGKGGVLIRFAGPDLAEAASDAAPKLLPVILRGGGRAFGGALSWEEPQLLSSFAATGPFADLAPPTDVFVRRQVLATPGAETTARAWVSLEDGTPLVTGEARGQGALVLFHVTATPDWSDLPISGVFVEMLRRVIFLSALGPQSVEQDGDTRLAPISVLDGFGALQPPPPTLQGVTIAEANAGPTRRHPPGLYGAREAPIAINAVSSGETLAPFSISGLDTEAYVTAPPERVAPWLFVVAIALLLIDALASLVLAGRLRVAVLLLMLGGAVALAPEQSVAQALQLPVAAKTEQAALATSFAYVRTGDQSVDRLSRLGLATLSRQLTARTAVEPGEPVAIDPAVDDLSVYPLVYWPLIAGAETPSGETLSNIETFMRFGGLVIFDTRDDERAIAGLETPERRALQNILRNIDTPPLLPLPDDHVLTRSFYLLEDLPGRMANNPVWVQAAGDRNDGVTPLIIGGRDWAGAWAADDVGRNVLPMARGGDRGRELAYRAGINMVMVALTGNYKSDQVHTPILLERLGR